MNPEQIMNTVHGVALCKRPTLRNTYDLTRRVIEESIPGDFVECGVFAGAQVGVMALTLQSMGVLDRKIHLYDSFEGIPEAGPEDDQQPGIGAKAPDAAGRLISTGISACSVEEVQGWMRKWGVDPSLLEYHKGWFQHTISDWAGGPIALLRLDGDLYSSTKACLDGLYPHLSDGGFLIVDDYALTGCRKAVHECLGQQAKLTKIEGGGGPAWWVK